MSIVLTWRNQYQKIDCHRGTKRGQTPPLRAFPGPLRASCKGPLRAGVRDTELLKRGVEFRGLYSGISKPMVCQTYGLHAGRLSRKWRKSRKRRIRRRQLRQLQTRSWLLDSRKSRKSRKWWKPREARVQTLETNLASRWKWVRLPRASGKSPDFPEVPRTSPEVFGDFPGSSLTVELNSNPEVPRKFPKLPRKFPKLRRKLRDFPGGQPLSLGSLTPLLTHKNFLWKPRVPQTTGLEIPDVRGFNTSGRAPELGPARHVSSLEVSQIMNRDSLVDRFAFESLLFQIARFESHCLGCQKWQSRVADVFCYFWAVFSKRLLTKSVVWKGAQQTLSIPPAAAEGLQVHFNMGASTMPRRQPKSVPESMLWKCLQEPSFSIKKTRREPGGLTGGFVGRFCGGFLGLAGGFRGGCAPADFLFSAGGFSGGFFFCILRPKNPPQKSTTKSTASTAVFW